MSDHKPDKKTPAKERPSTGMTSENSVELLAGQLQDAYMVIGQKEMQIQRQQLLIQNLQYELSKQSEID